MFLTRASVTATKSSGVATSTLKVAYAVNGAIAAVGTGVGTGVGLKVGQWAPSSVSR